MSFIQWLLNIFTRDPVSNSSERKKRSKEEEDEEEIEELVALDII